MHQNETATTVNILGSRVHVITVSETVDRIEQWIKGGSDRCRRINVTGFHDLWVGHIDESYKAIINSADLAVPDGIAPTWISRLRGHPEAMRAPGAAIMSEFFRRADREGYKSYFYGDTNATLDSLCNKLTDTWPGHRVAGVYSPPFRALTPEEDQEAIDRINDASPDILWVGLGAPKQDRWIYDRLDRLKVPVAIGVGAAFAFTAGTVQRCPAWLGSMGLEWAYRLVKEPKKVWRRDLLDGPRFLFHVGMELSGIRKYSEEP